jgi:hypothetical protein
MMVGAKAGGLPPSSIDCGARHSTPFICPQGKSLTTTGRVHDGRTILYRASTGDCGPMPDQIQMHSEYDFPKNPP